ncbi:hypothetical protein [Mucilaginibacter sp.]|uniref:hypothetical protein n=1 Tax=Mucilaginibacter sp. TaxID=1882438 RepID=UPI000CB02405|nr:hypothetical protein [Mucilaginibacter sp.]PLW89422.1 MAG: hypothetical protein C0154_11630 [Mucilaginibacter sp.]HEK21608.1 hypothetical protein [Bacteroidota bacterium]
MRSFCIFILLICVGGRAFSQHSDELANLKKLRVYQDSLIILGKKFVNDTDDLERKNANYRFIRTLVSALKVPHSFNYPFDSLKTVSILNSPDSRFRVFTWHIMNQDGSYRYFGTVQMNTGDKLLMYPLEDYTPFFKNSRDTVTDNRHWYGAQYYKIIRVAASKPYYALLGWKGNNIRSTKKVIEILSFDREDHPVLGMPVFNNKKDAKRIIFEYTRQASMLLRYVPEQNLIVFDHLSPPDDKMKDRPETYGPDLTYDGYSLQNGSWFFVENMDMRNIPQQVDDGFVDPKIQSRSDRKLLPQRKRN